MKLPQTFSILSAERAASQSIVGRACNSLSRCLPAILFLLTTSAWAVQPICDATCKPDPSSPTYTGTVGSRPRLENARSAANRLAPLQRVSAQTINVGSDSFNYTVPVLSLPGRNGLDLNLTLYYNSRIWNVNSSPATMTFNADRDFPSYGFRLDFGYLEYNSSGNSYVLTESDGGKHTLPNSGTSSYDSADSSYIHLDSSQMMVYYRNGTQVSFQQFPSTSSLFRPTQITDTNGNFIAISYVSGKDQAINTVTDTVGRVITFNYDGAGRLVSLTQGTKTWATFGWNTAYVLNYAFSLAVQDSPASGSVLNVLTSCQLANGVSYQYLYGDWGIVNRIEYRSNTNSLRSYYSYNFPSATTALNDAPTYTQESVSPDGTTSYQWTSNVTKSGVLVSSYALTDPSGTTTTTQLATLGFYAGLVSSAQVSSGGTALRTITDTWTSDSGANARLASVTATLNDSGQQAQVVYGYDGYGNVTDSKQYDYSGALLKETATTYWPATSNHILDHPSQVLVKDGSGTIIGRTDYAYDQSALATFTNVAGHLDSWSSARGNLTTVTRYANAAAGTGAVTRAFSYDTLGNVLTAQLDCCNEKSWGYSAATQYAYPDSVTRGPAGGPQLTTVMTYDLSTGALLTSQDENNQITHFSYDPSVRLQSITRPDNVQTTIGYDDSSAQPLLTRSSTANSLVTRNTSDGAGRVTSEQVLNGTTLVSTVSATYDGLNRVSQKSNPYGPSEAAKYTVTSYDALGRVYSLTPPGNSGSFQYQFSGNATTATDPAGKQRRTVTDALGRISEVDEPGYNNGTPGSGPITINGSEQTTQVQTSGPTPGTGSVTISGYEKPPKRVSCGNRCFITEYDSGSVEVFVSGALVGGGDWAQGSTANSAATSLVNSINSNGASPVTASLSGNSVVVLTSKASGAASNYSLSVSVVDDDPANWPSPSYSASASGPALTGGSNATFTTVYDSGNVTVTVTGANGTAAETVSYGQGSTAASVAAAIAAAYNSDGNPVVSAGSSSNVLTLTSKANGANTNYSVSGSSTTGQGQYFGSPSFSATSGSLSGGQDPWASLTNPAVTTYTYTPADNLSQVSSGAQTRSYSYDGLDRLASATTPESGQALYTYYDFGGVNTRTDARGVVTSYSYDGLNRPIQISYNVGATGVPPTATVGFTYGSSPAGNNNGSLISMTDGTGSESYSYDPMGRMTQLAKVINSVNYTIGYHYNSADELDTLTYPSGRVVQRSYDSIGRLSQILNAGVNALNNITYNGAGQPLSVGYGNGVQGSFGYNDRLQISSLSYSAGSTSLLNLSYSYGTNANGQISGITDARGAAYSTTYSYDPLGRIARAQTNDLGSANTWCLAWSYDRYGNRLSQTGCGGTLSVTQPQLTVSASTNRVNSYSYDANGNLTNDGTYGYVYDAENRMVQVSGGTSASYTYDGNGLRVQKGSTIYVYSGAKVVAEYVSGTLSKEYVYSGSKLLATVAAGATTYHHPDHLSTRVDTDANGNQIRTYGSLPFGDSWYESGPVDKWKFTTYERDGETGLDYAVARHYSNRIGRFMSADPLGGNIFDPQSLNRYSYVQNDPLNAVDPLGLRRLPIHVFSCPQDTEGGFSIWDCSFGSFSVGDIDGPTGPPEGPGGGGGHRTPKQVKDDFYSKFKKKLNGCIRSVFGNDAPSIPAQTRKNAPILDATKNESEVGSVSGVSGAAGSNDPNHGPHGTVFVAKEIYNSKGPNATNAIYGTFVHELGNILDERLHPNSPTYGRDYGNPQATDDTDTGAALEKCLFGSLQYPD